MCAHAMYAQTLIMLLNAMVVRALKYINPKTRANICIGLDESSI